MSSTSTSETFPLRSVDLVLAMLKRIRPLQVTMPMLADEQQRLRMAEQIGYNRCIHEMELFMHSNESALAEAARAKLNEPDEDDGGASLDGWGSSDPKGFGVLGGDE